VTLLSVQSRTIDHPTPFSTMHGESRPSLWLVTNRKDIHLCKVCLWWPCRYVPCAGHSHLDRCRFYPESILISICFSQVRTAIPPRLGTFLAQEQKRPLPYHSRRDLRCSLPAEIMIDLTYVFDLPSSRNIHRFQVPYIGFFLNCK